MAEKQPLLEIVPQPYSWTGPVTDGGFPQYVKIFSHFTLLAPVQPGALATVTLTVDPGLANQVVVTVQFDLSGTGAASTVNGEPYENAAGQPLDLAVLHTTTIGDPTGGEIRGHLARLTCTTNAPHGPAPQVWNVTAWGEPTQPLVVRT